MPNTHTSRLDRQIAALDRQYARTDAWMAAEEVARDAHIEAERAYFGRYDGSGGIGPAPELWAAVEATKKAYDKAEKSASLSRYRLRKAQRDFQAG